MSPRPTKPKPNAKRSAPPPNARKVALDALARIEQHGAYANLALPAALESSGLDGRDRRFVTELVYGTTRMRRACDFLVDRFVTRDPAPEVRTLLRLGAYQLAFTDVPDHAAVSSIVELAPRGASGFVNAVLRKVATAPTVWPDLPTRLSYPDWIVARLIADLGEPDAIAALERMNQPPPVTERDDGYTQDLASTWVADEVGAEPGMRVLDLCAAPGGKATRLAANGAHVVAADIRLGRVQLLARNAKRLDSPIAVLAADATAPPFAPASFDRVLLDAPCSGLGALRRRADARWHITEHDVTELADLQRRMLAAALPLVRPGGLLVFSVCTLTCSESVDHDSGERAALEALPPPPAPWRPHGRGALLLPHDADTDGMALMRWRATIT